MTIVLILKVRSDDIVSFLLIFVCILNDESMKRLREYYDNQQTLRLSVSRYVILRLFLYVVILCLRSVSLWLNSHLRA